MVTDARSERVAFFAMLHDAEHPLELRYWPSGRSTPSKAWAMTPETADEKAHALTTAGHDVFVGVLPRVGVAGENQRQYAPARALYVDLDSARGVGKAELFEPEPTAIVLSGGVDGDTPKRHYYWRLTAPLPAEQVKRHVARLAHHLGGDERVTDAARVLRVPGSRSHKTGRVARLVSFTGEAVGLERLTGDLPDAPDYRPAGESRPAKTTDELVALFRGTYADGDGRHDRFRSAVGVLLARCDRLPPDVLLELAVSWAQAHTRPCKPRAELERNFDHLLARERARRRIA